MVIVHEGKTMASRDLLHKSKLENFLKWAVDKKGATIENGCIQWQKARIRFPNGDLHVVYDNIRSDHYSIEKKTAIIFKDFKAWENQNT